MGQIEGTHGGGPLLQRARELRNFSMRAVCERLNSESVPFSLGTLSRIESGTTPVRADRLRALLDLYGLPDYLAHDLESMIGHSSLEETKGSLQELHDASLDAWRNSDFRRSMDLFIQAKCRVHTADPVTKEDRDLAFKITFNFAHAAKQCGKLRLARELIEEIDTKGVTKKDRTRMLLTLAQIQRELGHETISRGLLIHAKTLCMECDNSDRMLGWINQDQAALENDAGNSDLALSFIDQARILYEQTGDLLNLRSLKVFRVRCLIEAGRLEEARDFGQQVFEETAENESSRHHALAAQYLGSVQHLLGQTREAKRLLSIAVTIARDSDDKDVLFWSCYESWKVDRRRTTAEFALAALAELDYASEESIQARQELLQAVEEQDS